MKQREASQFARVLIERVGFHEAEAICSQMFAHSHDEGSATDWCRIDEEVTRLTVDDKED